MKMPIPPEKFLKVSAKSARNCWDRRRGKGGFNVLLSP
jgi:hypothetical protein